MAEPTPPLLPCPFCGASASGHEIEPHQHSAALLAMVPDMPKEHLGSYVIEGDCQCGSGLIGDNQAEVTARWNSRAPQAVAAQAPAGNWINADDVDRLVRELDVALHGENDAAPQAALCDVVGLVKEAARKLGRPVLSAHAAVADGDGFMEAVNELDGLYPATEDSSAGDLAEPVQDDPMDWPLPCDVTVGCVTICKGVKLRTLVTRMEVLHKMATAQAEVQAEPVASPTDVVYRWQALNYSGYCYGSNPPDDLPTRCNLTAFYRQPDAFRAALREISATGNLTATGQQFARHLQQIARDALAATPVAAKLTAQAPVGFVYRNSVTGEFELREYAGNNHPMGTHVDIYTAPQAQPADALQATPPKSNTLWRLLTNGYDWEYVTSGHLSERDRTALETRAKNTWAAICTEASPKGEQAQPADAWTPAATVPAESDGEVFVKFTDGSIGTAWTTYWHGASNDFAQWSFPDPDEDRTVAAWMKPPAAMAAAQEGGAA